MSSSNLTPFGANSPRHQRQTSSHSMTATNPVTLTKNAEKLADITVDTRKALSGIPTTDVENWSDTTLQVLGLKSSIQESGGDLSIIKPAYQQIRDIRQDTMATMYPDANELKRAEVTVPLFQIGKGLEGVLDKKLEGNTDQQQQTSASQTPFPTPSVEQPTYSARPSLPLPSPLASNFASASIPEYTSHPMTKTESNNSIRLPDPTKLNLSPAGTSIFNRPLTDFTPSVDMTALPYSRLPEMSSGASTLLPSAPLPRIRTNQTPPEERTSPVQETVHEQLPQIMGFQAVNQGISAPESSTAQEQATVTHKKKRKEKEVLGTGEEASASGVTAKKAKKELSAEQKEQLIILSAQLPKLYSLIKEQDPDIYNAINHLAPQSSLSNGPQASLTFFAQKEIYKPIENYSAEQITLERRSGKRADTAHQTLLEASIAWGVKEAKIIQKHTASAPANTETSYFVPQDPSSSAQDAPEQSTDAGKKKVKSLSKDLGDARFPFREGVMKKFYDKEDMPDKDVMSKIKFPTEN